VLLSTGVCYVHLDTETMVVESVVKYRCLLCSFGYRDGGRGECC